MTDDLNIIKKNPGVLKIYSKYIKLKKLNKEFISLCPFHQEKTPSFRISLFDGAYIWKCFGCAQNGDIIDFVSKIENSSLPAAVSLVKQELGLETKNLFSETKKAEQVFHSISGDEKQTITYTLDEYNKLENTLENSEEGRAWLASRGILYEIARENHLGFKQDIGNLAGEKNKDIAKLGWISFPCIENGVIVAIKYRSIKQKVFTKQSGMAKGESTPLFPNDQIDPFEMVLLVEGEVDQLTLQQAGFQVKSAQSSSSPLTAKNKEKLLEADCVILAGDNDTVGNEFIDKLWSELQERTFKLIWPDNMKDANETFLSRCKGNLEEFRKFVLELIQKAKSTPLPGVCDLKESLLTGQRTDLETNPFRFKFPWKSMDSMANILPGAVVYLSSTNTGMGKTSIIMNATIDAALHGEVILNYSAELDPPEFGQIVVAHLCKKDRNSLVQKDYERTYNILKDTRYYLAHDPDLTTANQVIDIIEAGIRRLGAGTVVLDHIHFVTLNEKDTIKAQENAMQRIKNIARKYRVKWINLGQPRKAKQDMKGKASHITDAKGSESLISGSDVAYNLHRELAKVDDPAHPPKEPYEPLCKIYLQKGRSQGKGNAYTELMFNGSTCSYYEVDNFTEERLL
jgi:5S rRNA maturation endonuclease (ribonuclease M5)